PKRAPASGARPPAARTSAGRQRGPVRAAPTASAGPSGAPAAARTQPTRRNRRSAAATTGSKWSSRRAGAVVGGRASARRRRRRSTTSAVPAAAAPASPAAAARSRAVGGIAMRRILGSRRRSHASPPIAVLSDVHANRQALDAVLRAVREAGGREWWCLGDVVGYGADPVHCLHACLAGASRCLAGNHDLGASGEADIAQFAGEAGDAVAWTRRGIGRPGAAPIGRPRPAGTTADGPPLPPSARQPGRE